VSLRRGYRGEAKTKTTEPRAATDSQSAILAQGPRSSLIWSLKVVRPYFELLIFLRLCSCSRSDPPKLGRLQQ